MTWEATAGRHRAPIPREFSLARRVLSTRRAGPAAATTKMKQPLVLVLLVSGSMAGCSADCEEKTCDGLAAEVGSETSNGRAYQECVSCTSEGRCFNELIDEADATVFECTSEPDTTDCTDAFVNAQFAYCGI